MKYRKKPVVIDAIQYSGDNAVEIDEFVGQTLTRLLMSPVILVIPTLEGDMKASSGDYIIKGVKGEFYPCKPDIFESTYEKLNEELI